MGVEGSVTDFLQMAGQAKAFKVVLEMAKPAETAPSIAAVPAVASTTDSAAAQEHFTIGTPPSTPRGANLDDCTSTIEDDYWWGPEPNTGKCFKPQTFNPLYRDLHRWGPKPNTGKFFKPETFTSKDGSVEEILMMGDLARALGTPSGPTQCDRALAVAQRASSQKGNSSMQSSA